MMNLLLRYIYVVFIISTLFMSSCTSKKETVLEFAKTDAYAQAIYEAISAGDFDAYLTLCVNPEVTVGNEAKKMVLEIEATQEAQARGRLLTPDSGVILKTWEYYQANVL